MATRRRDLARCVNDLVRAATPDAEPRRLQRAVQETLDAFDRAPREARDGAVRAIGRALAKKDGHGAHVLALTLGALVEGGASPETAWPALARGLPTLLDGATAFVAAAIAAAKDDVVENALGTAGAVVALAMPREAAAFEALPSRCLAAVACLTRSKSLRAKARRDDALLASAWPLSDAVDEVGALVQAMRVLDDAPVLVLAPDAAAGWRFVADGLASNLDLYVLLADALFADAKKARLPGKRIDPKALAVLRGETSPKKPPRVTFPFELLPWTAMRRDGSLPETAGSLSLDDVPADIPALGAERVVLVRAAALGPVLVEPTFEALRPRLRLVEVLAPGEVLRALVALAGAMPTTPSHPEPPQAMPGRATESGPRRRRRPRPGDEQA